MLTNKPRHDIQSDGLTALERVGNISFLFAMFVLSVLLIVFGLIFTYFRDFFVTAGSALLGSSLGAIFGLLTGERLQQDVSKLYSKITSILSVALKFPWSTDENILRKHRIRLHEYHITRAADEEFWTHRELDFSIHFTPGRLYALETISMHNEEYEYEFEGFLIEQRLIITCAAKKHDENISISIYNDYGTKLHKESGYFGIQIHNDFNATDGFDPCIISKEPLFNLTDDGRQTLDACKKLTEHWTKKLAPTVGIRTLP